MTKIYYKSGYKYQLAEDYDVETHISIMSGIDMGFVTLTRSGRLTIRAGYAWDGPSGPTFDTKNFMRGSLIHDALYQLMRSGDIDRERWKEPADRLLQAICREDGMSSIRAWWVYQGVAKFGHASTMPGSGHPIQTAP